MPEVYSILKDQKPFHVLLCQFKIFKTVLQGVSILRSANSQILMDDAGSGSELSNVMAEKKVRRAWKRKGLSE